MAKSPPVFTPDGRYLVVRGRLWRTANPDLTAESRGRLVRELMKARGAVGLALARGDEAELALERSAVQAAKESLGERGPVWWDDGAPDYNRFLAKNTPYADWWSGLAEDDGP